MPDMRTSRSKAKSALDAGWPWLMAALVVAICVLAVVMGRTRHELAEARAVPAGSTAPSCTVYVLAHSMTTTRTGVILYFPLSQDAAVDVRELLKGRTR